ncbi:hypothetical protein C0J52_14044 [Blattella germanica]|nr:hypothetical protein C0J52_14044 [Blattella germanica]
MLGINVVLSFLQVGLFKMAAVEWPWQYSFPPFFTIQPHNETKIKQISAWRNLVLDYHKNVKQCHLDIREAQRSPLFCNSSINRKLPLEGILMVLDDLARTGNAEPVDKQKHRWYVYWHTLDEWAEMVYCWAQNSGMHILRSGHQPVSNENVQMVSALVEMNRNVMICQLEQDTRLVHSTVLHILKDLLKMRKVASKWVPHELTDMHKWHVTPPFSRHQSLR